ncbi:hypothetical protein AX13_17090 [Comamonas aquatica DA1877]|uniref:Uncharacterized protein n=1 Tax=Comamonas aquatica DA1877 TaxID=1457173 RepID=A0A014MQG7_9BURK|nr:hypothetical protein [Comamonas aquatica]EXU80409.1 hypothetical protein AX13_17090 [Comamonas aquatica DA1877]
MHTTHNTVAPVTADADPRPAFAPLQTTPIGPSTDPHHQLTDREARRLVNEVRTWARQFDAPDAKALVSAMNDMERLLSWVWTEIDESVLRLNLSATASTPERADSLRREAIGYLCRWNNRRPPNRG